MPSGWEELEGYVGRKWATDPVPFGGHSISFPRLHLTRHPPGDGRAAEDEVT